MLRPLAVDPQSGIIDGVQYDVETGEMRVTFKSNQKTYKADGVPPSVATAIEQPGASAGKIWHSTLKTQFTWTEVE